MPFEQVLVSETLTTLFTYKWFLAFMNTRNVGIECRARTKRSVAAVPWTHVFLARAVEPHVSPQAFAAGVRAPTYVALRWMILPQMRL